MRKGFTEDPNDSHTESQIALKTGEKNDQKVRTISKNITPLKTCSLSTISSSIKQDPVNNAAVLPQPHTYTIKDVEEIDRKNPPTISIFTGKTSNYEPEAEANIRQLTSESMSLEKFAPFGRLIKCELVNTIESCNLNTPIIALITEPVYWNGRIIIPAGSEVHGKANSSHIRDRIISCENWKIVLLKDSNRVNGAVLNIKGVALDQDSKDGQNRTFGITDGSYGLKGYRVESARLEELKIFSATFIGALAAGLQTIEPLGSVGDSKVRSDSRNAALGGISAVMSRFADNIERQILEDGLYFTRVQAGKQFYLYVEQLINPSDLENNYKL